MGPGRSFSLPVGLRCLVLIGGVHQGVRCKAQQAIKYYYYFSPFYLLLRYIYLSEQPHRAGYVYYWLSSISIINHTTISEA